MPDPFPPDPSMVFPAINRVSSVDGDVSTIPFFSAIECVSLSLASVSVRSGTRLNNISLLPKKVGQTSSSHFGTMFSQDPMKFGAQFAGFLAQSPNQIFAIPTAQKKPTNGPILERRGITF